MVLDELGYLPFSQVGGVLPFRPLSKLYERTTIITTALNFAEGAGVFVLGEQPASASEQACRRRAAGRYDR